MQHFPLCWDFTLYTYVQGSSINKITQIRRSWHVHSDYLKFFRQTLLSEEFPQCSRVQTTFTLRLTYPRNTTLADYKIGSSCSCVMKFQVIASELPRGAFLCQLQLASCFADNTQQTGSPANMLLSIWRVVHPWRVFILQAGTCQGVGEQQSTPVSLSQAISTTPV